MKNRIMKKLFNCNEQATAARNAHDWKTYGEAVREYSRLTCELARNEAKEAESIARNAREQLEAFARLTGRR